MTFKWSWSFSLKTNQQCCFTPWHWIELKPFYRSFVGSSLKSFVLGFECLFLCSSLKFTDSVWNYICFSKVVLCSVFLPGLSPRLFFTFLIWIFNFMENFFDKMTLVTMVQRFDFSQNFTASVSVEWWLNNSTQYPINLLEKRALDS